VRFGPRGALAQLTESRGTWFTRVHLTQTRRAPGTTLYRVE
jgi:hypothetical protein